jgi:VIT1/CCC1 family predicted Fe2+/Mn2+ transporter
MATPIILFPSLLLLFILGFYEAELVKTPPRKSVFKVCGSFWPRSGNTMPLTGFGV